MLINLGKRIIVTVFYQRRKRHGNETIVSAKFPDLKRLFYKHRPTQKLITKSKIVA